jgi:hypothetical protein
MSASLIWSGLAAGGCPFDEGVLIALTGITRALGIDVPLSRSPISDALSIRLTVHIYLSSGPSSDGTVQKKCRCKDAAY